MNDKKLEYAREILLYFEKYLKQIEDENDDRGDLILDFSRWIINSNDNEKEAGGHGGSEMSDILIGMHLVNLANLLKKEQNHFVSETPFSSFMDFQFLFILNEHGNMTKSQLISANNMEMSSGIEVINRLKRSVWIKETENPEDRRSKLIYATDDGKDVLDKYRTRGQNIYKSYSERLEETEKMTVLKSLELLSSLNS